MNSKGQTSIFIVEDNFMCSYLLEAMLKDQGNFRITTFASGEECIELIGNNPDIVVLDYNLGKGMNGLETLKKIRTLKPATSVIILSGELNPDLGEALLQEGALAHIDKKNMTMAMEQLTGSILDVMNRN